MPKISISVTVPARRGTVWRDLAQLHRHVEWMADAERITFTSRRRRGVGTTFDCLTRVGPIRLNDQMVVFEWRPRRSIGIRHVGMVTGTGRFRLHGGRLWPRTRLTWQEELHFPLWLGGSMGARVAAVVLRSLWKANLRRFRQRFS